MLIHFNEFLSSLFMSNVLIDKVSIVLTPIQKKVTLIAIAILSTSTLCLSYRYFRSYKKREKNNLVRLDQQKDVSPLKKKAIKRKKSPIKKQEIKKLEPIESKELKIPQKSIAQRLEDNRRDAQEQQKNEEDKRFSLTDQTDMTVIKINEWNQQIQFKIKAEEKEVNGTNVGIAATQGRRSTMEDADIACSQSLTIQGKDYVLDLFGVFDGHAGSNASTFVRKNIVEYLTKALINDNQQGLTDEGIFKAVKESFKKLDIDYPGQEDGTTATVAFILDGKIWVANTGDSRTILVKDGEIIQASEDAKPEMKNYKKGIEKLGGYVLFNRVLGNLAVARAIGDKQFSTEKDKFVLPNPKITHYSLKDFENGYLVLACDGLYDVATTNQVGQAINEMNQKGLSVKEMSQRLVYSAIVCQSQDNVSVVVVKI